MAVRDTLASPCSTTTAEGGGSNPLSININVEHLRAKGLRAVLNDNRFKMMLNVSDMPIDLKSVDMLTIRGVTRWWLPSIMWRMRERGPFESLCGYAERTEELFQTDKLYSRGITVSYIRPLDAF